MLITRYLAQHEYIRTYRLFREAFGDDEAFLMSLYGNLDGNNHCTGSINSHHVLVTEDESGEIISMLQLVPMRALIGGKEADVTYIMGVATRSDHRREGLMSRLMSNVEAELRSKGEPFCFVVAVDKAIYRGRGYVHDWRFDEKERMLLSADDDLCECSAKLLNSANFEAPAALWARDETTSPLKPRNITVTRSSLPPLEEYIDEIRELWDTGWLTNMGVKHDCLERALRDFLETPEVTLFTNGHLALEAALAAWRFPRGGEVITTPFTFASTTHAIVRQGLTPVFCDIREDDFTMDASLIEPLISERTVAILPVHVYGHIADAEAIDAIGRAHGLKVIYDGAHAFGVDYHGRSPATFGDMTMYSFHATKVFHTIEGGALCYSDPLLRPILNDIKDFGFHGQESVDFVGGNAKMSEFQAAMGLCNLRHIGEEIYKRSLVAQRYRERLSGIEGIRLPGEDPMTRSNYAYFPVILDGYFLSRDEVRDLLKEHGIFARKYFYPLTSLFNCYRDLPTAPTPVARSISEKVLTLPLYADLSLTDVDRIADIIIRGRS